MDGMTQMRDIKRRVLDSLLILANDDPVVRQVGIVGIGDLLEDCKIDESLENVKHILVEILMSVITHSAVDSRTRNLSNFVPCSPVISDLSDNLRLQSMVVLLNTDCYDVVDIVRRISSAGGSQTQNPEDLIPEHIIRPLLERIVDRHKHNTHVINETISFLCYNEHCINSIMDICFCLEELDLLNMFLYGVLPNIETGSLSEVFNYIHTRILSLDLNNSEPNQYYLSLKLNNLVYLLMANSRCEYSLINILVITVSKIGVHMEINYIILSVIILSSIMEHSNKERRESVPSGDPIQFINLLKTTLENGAIKGFIEGNFDRVRDLMFTTVTILLFKSKDILEFEKLLEISEIFLRNFTGINTLTLLSALVYHMKGNMFENDPFNYKSKKFLKEKFRFNIIEEINNMEFDDMPYQTYLGRDVNEEISSLLTNHSHKPFRRDFSSVVESVEIRVIGNIYNGLSSALNYLKIRYFLECNLTSNYIYDEIFCFSVFNLLLKWSVRFIGSKHPVYSRRIVALTKKLVILNKKYQILVFDSIYPIYEFILKLLENITGTNAIVDSIHGSMISFGSNRNTVPIICNKITSVEHQPETKTLEKLYHLFLKGELPYSRLESLLYTQINSELSNTGRGLDEFQNGLKILFCIVRYRPEVINERIIRRLQGGLKSKNKDVVAYSIHCLTEMCKNRVVDCNKCIENILSVHSNILINESSLPRGIPPLKVSRHQHFGISRCTYPTEILSSFIRYSEVYIDRNWPMYEETYQRKPHNNLFYVLSMLSDVIKERRLESVYCINIISGVILDFFYQHVNMNTVLSNFISSCVKTSLPMKVDNFFDLIDVLQSFFTVLDRKKIDFDLINFVTHNISGPLRSILRFESTNGAYYLKRQVDGQRFGMYNINSKYNTVENELGNPTPEDACNRMIIRSSGELVHSKLKSIQSRTTHNFCTQEAIYLFMYDPRQIREEIVKRIDRSSIEEFKMTIIRDLIKFIRSVKFISCATFQWQIIFQFSKIIKEYLNQLELLFVESLSKSRNKRRFGNIDDEVFLLFFLFLSYLPSVRSSYAFFNDHSETIMKCRRIRETESKLSDELFIENQANAVLCLSSLVILRYDLLGRLYDNYVSDVPNIEILPNKLFVAFINSDIIINKFFLNKSCFLQYFSANRVAGDMQNNVIVEVFQRTYYVNKEVSVVDFVSSLLKHLHQHSLSHTETLKSYFEVAHTEFSANVYTFDGLENQLVDKIYVSSNFHLINSYTFGVFSFFDIAFDNFSEKSELLDTLLCICNISMNCGTNGLASVVFRTASIIKLFQHKMVTTHEVFDLLRRLLIIFNDESSNGDSGQETCRRLELIRTFCFSYINYHLKKIFDRPTFRNERVPIIEEYENFNFSAIKNIISEIFYENETAENQALIISCISLSRGCYWVPWAPLLYCRPIFNLDTLNDLCGVIFKNHASYIELEVLGPNIHNVFSNIDLLLQSCSKDPVKMTMCILILSLHTVSLTNSLENKLRLHNREKYFDVNLFSKNSLLIASISKLETYAFRLMTQIERMRKNNQLVNIKNSIILQDLIMIGAIIETFEDAKICDKFTNFDISNSLNIILIGVTIPLCDAVFIKDNDEENRRILEWFVLLITRFLTCYLNSNCNFVPRVIDFGYSLIRVIKNSSACELILLSFARIIGVIFLTCDSNLSFLNEFIIAVFDALSNMANRELHVTTLLVNLGSVFSSPVINKRPLLSTKIENVLIKSLGEISYRLHKFNSMTILKSFKFLIGAIHSFLESINHRGTISRLSKSINPLLLDELILENKLNIKIIHKYYLNLDIEKASYELISLANFYYLYSLKSRSAETEVLNFLYKDFVESGEVSIKHTVVITTVLTLMLIPDSATFLSSYNNDKNLNIDDMESYKIAKSSGWTDLVKLYSLDLKKEPELNDWNKLFSNDDGIIFLSKHYYSLKQELFSVVDTNLFSDKEIVSSSVYEYPKIFLYEQESDMECGIWRKSIQNLFSYPRFCADRYKTIYNPLLNFNYSNSLSMLYKLLYKLEDRHLRPEFMQFKDKLIIVVKKIIEYNVNRNSIFEINLV